MLYLKASACIEAPVDQVWAVLADLERISEWSEAVVSASCPGPLSRGVAAERECVLSNDLCIKERIVAWEEGRYLRYEGFNIPLMARASNCWSVAGHGDKTLLTTESEMVLKGGWPAGCWSHCCIGPPGGWRGKRWRGLSIWLNRGGLIGGVFPSCLRCLGFVSVGGDIVLTHWPVKKAPFDSALHYCLLAFIAMAGLAYINFLPGVVNALAGEIGFSEAEAGQIVAFNGYGGLVGSTVAIFLVRRVHWQTALFVLLAALTFIDISTVGMSAVRMDTVGMDGFSAMLAWRFLAGTVGGLCVGIAFSVLARLNNPERAFGLLLLVQFAIGSLVIYSLPALEARLGAYAVFYMMASFALLACAFLLFIPALPAGGESTQAFLALSGQLANKGLLLLAILCYPCAASAIWAYVGLIGLGAGFSAEAVSSSIALTGMLGLIGAMLPVIIGNRFGRLFWLVGGIALSIIAALMLSISPLTQALYIASMALLFFSWPAVQSYLLAVTAEMDASGQLSTMAAVAASLGLASGPLLASGLLDQGDFSVMLYASGWIFLLSFFLLVRPVQAYEKG
ncbi:SRPBCC family protein [Oceanicoccus sagamiensis]|uniref:Major facilitator superfamily (MFS) profile domain-containing protein n=1 Tax=Oceanicoccus sagamiensis TaxID=716816 RepID=A0A1X9ND51_9GAMM|nr:SRPBCC family protein [Oceanicoccus sagamiensis]ARN73835.1 hypothetical protein BST96_06730 [Oceanicoccus sagamiensis]